VLIDIGGGTTDIAYFEGGKLLHASVLPVGGDYITRDLAIVLKTSLEHAVKIKEEDGVAGPEQASDANIIKVQNLRGKEVRQVSQQVIADIINARVVELIEMIYAELKRFGCLEQMPGGIVLTGGAAQLKGIDEVMEKHLDITVRLGIPENLRGVQSDINRPEYATVIGGLIYAGIIWAFFNSSCRSFMALSVSRTLINLSLKDNTSSSKVSFCWVTVFNF
jgi:cell division protein FtsA